PEGGTDRKRALERDDFVIRPISALRFISLALRRTFSTPHATRFARLELGPITKSSNWMTPCKIITRGDVKIMTASQTPS
ncbi:MAG TPA: hypothetical protein VFX82_14300, partial [Desulfobacterales bacterium]|nr:hypothetical protein [Desulfobacterales bacterium]